MTQTKYFNEFKISSVIVTEPQVHTFTNSSLVRFALILSRNERHGEETITSKAFLNIEKWAKSAEDFADLKKGSKVNVSGYFKPRNWTDSNDVAHNSISFVATSIEVLPKEDAPKQ